MNEYPWKRIFASFQILNGLKVMVFSKKYKFLCFYVRW